MFIQFVFIFPFFCVANSAEIGKCDELVADFSLDLEFDNASNDTILKCNKVLNCFGSLNTTDGDKLKKLYELRCEKYEFYKIKGTRCSDQILNDQIWRNSLLPISNKKPSESQSMLFSLKPSIRGIATRNCSKAFQNYLTTNYTQFVDYWTSYGSCESVNAELANKELLFLGELILRNWKIYIYRLQISIKPGDENFARESCRRLEALSQSSCQNYRMEEAIKACETIDVITSRFYGCTKEFGSNLFSVSVGKCRKNNKKCVQNAMTKKCGEIESFDKYYNWFEEHGWSKPCVIGVFGNWSKYSIYMKSDLKESSELGSCAGLVDDLISILSRNKEAKSENIGIAAKVCDKVMNCYKSVNSTESEAIQKSFQIVCDKLNFSENNMYKCVDKFFRSERKDKNSTFFSSNLPTKRDAFTSNKTYFLDFTKQKCSRKAKNYLRTNYDHFVNLMTSKPKNDRCNSVLSRIETQQCTQFVREKSRSYPNFKYQRNVFIPAIVLKECALFKQCMNTCPTPDIPKLNRWCEVSKEGILGY
ncbi:unnamed protein product [Caenorhabditis brenneri]